ncbi:MAG: phenylalanine--tRNA ligase subunit beta, partial [Bacteroidales bacterium]|nr:phenylalanine--tRNA ligase subunit beta [Bacteroidales bacterium]
MKISYNWLKQYVDIDISAEKVAELLTFGGLEVEDVEVVETIKGGLKNYVVGHVLTCEMHPNSDHLHITTVDVGLEQPLNIVCGAPNVAAGQKVIVAKVGAKVYTSDDECFEIKRSKLRGELSEGMICSEKELCLSDNNDGIMVLDSDAVVGTPAKEYFNIQEDYVFEIGLTANRSDATSHIGVGRDLVALLKAQLNENKELQLPSVDAFATESTENNDLNIEIDTNLCKRYSAVTISGVKVMDSPQWLADRLRVIGIRPINNIVDATNFVLMETGQPLHAFDLKKIKSRKVVVKSQSAGTKFETLDGIERELNGKEAMVCDDDEPMCMGGIYGGLDSGVSTETVDLFLESAYFDPVVIRKAAKHHGLKTDASFRYERGADPNITVYALKRVALLIKEIAGGIISSEIKDVYPSTIEPVQIDLRYSYMDSLIGKSIERTLVKDILTSLNIQ